METLLTIISSLLGCSTLVGFILYGRANRRIKNAEAEKSEAEANEAEDHRFDNLLKLVDSLTSRLSKLNDTVDKHIDRNRELSDRLYQSGTEKTVTRAHHRSYRGTRRSPAPGGLCEDVALRKSGLPGSARRQASERKAERLEI